LVTYRKKEKKEKRRAKGRKMKDKVKGRGGHTFFTNYSLSMTFKLLYTIPLKFTINTDYEHQ